MYLVSVKKPISKSYLWLFLDILYFRCTNHIWFHLHPFSIRLYDNQIFSVYEKVYYCCFDRIYVSCLDT